MCTLAVTIALASSGSIGFGWQGLHLVLLLRHAPSAILSDVHRSATFRRSGLSRKGWQGAVHQLTLTSIG